MKTRSLSSCDVKSAGLVEVATELNRLQASIRARFNQHLSKSLEDPQSTKQHTRADDELIVQRRRDGVPLKRISADLGRSVKSTRSRLHRTPLLSQDDERRESGRERRYSAEADELICRLMEAGMPRLEIAAEVGIPQSRMEVRYNQYLLRRSSLDSKPRYRRFTTSEREQLICLRDQASLSWGDIAWKLSPPLASVRRTYCRVRGRSSERGSAKRRAYSAAEDQKLLHLKQNQRLPWYEIAAHMAERSKCSLTERYSRTLKDPVRRRKVCCLLSDASQ